MFAAFSVELPPFSSRVELSAEMTTESDMSKVVLFRAVVVFWERGEGRGSEVASITGLSEIGASLVSGVSFVGSDIV